MILDRNSGIVDVFGPEPTVLATGAGRYPWLAPTAQILSVRKHLRMCLPDHTDKKVGRHAISGIIGNCYSFCCTVRWAQSPVVRRAGILTNESRIKFASYRFLFHCSAPSKVLPSSIMPKKAQELLLKIRE